jgi:hypothetical protein
MPLWQTIIIAVGTSVVGNILFAPLRRWWVRSSEARIRNNEQAHAEQAATAAEWARDPEERAHARYWVLLRAVGAFSSLLAALATAAFMWGVDPSQGMPPDRPSLVGFLEVGRAFVFGLCLLALLLGTRTMRRMLREIRILELAMDLVSDQPPAPAHPESIEGGAQGESATAVLPRQRETG